MATTDRLFQDFLSFTTDADPGSGGLTLSAPGLADLQVVADPDFIALTLDPREVFGDPEIVWVSAHSSSATTATIVRAREGTTARAHDVGTVVIASLTSIAVTDLLDVDGTRAMTGSLDMGGQQIIDSAEIFPLTDVASDLGSTSKTWRTLYVDEVHDRAGQRRVDVETQQLVGSWIAGGLVPNTDVVDDLGTGSKTWRRLYVQDLYNPAGIQVADLPNRDLKGDWQVDGSWRPLTDNTRVLGSSGNRWTAVWAVDGTINTSDLREKRNVAAIRYGLDTVMEIEPIEYEWSSGRGGRRLGFGAQVVQGVIPEAIVADADPDVPLGQNSDMMLAVLWNAVRELGRRGQ